MKSIGEFFSVLPLVFLVRIRSYLEERRVRQTFYHNNLLKNCDLALLKSYQGVNPYRINNEFLKAKGETALDVYGETPLTTLSLIAEKCEITSNDIVLELGTGRGRAALFLSHYTGCKVKGVEWVPFFVEKGNEIAKKLCSNVEFICADISTYDFSGFSVIYLAGTCFSEELMHNLMPAFEKLRVGTKVITVSFPLSDYSQSFVVKKEFTASFFWGKTEIYLQEKVEQAT